MLMVDDKAQIGRGDRNRVGEEQGYEVSYFARKHGLTTEEAREIIKRVGSDREKLNAEVEKLARGARSEPRAKRRPVAKANDGKRPRQDRGRENTGRPSLLARAVIFGGAAAAGALLWSRRDQVSEQIRKLSDEINRLRPGRETHSDFAAQGTSGETFAVSDGSRTAGSRRSQAEIAEEALTLKETGRTAQQDPLGE
jgi:outer membrane murein-binding lipoprotein Lpp